MQEINKYYNQIHGPTQCQYLSTLYLFCRRSFFRGGRKSFFTMVSIDPLPGPATKRWQTYLFYRASWQQCIVNEALNDISWPKLSQNT